MPPKKDDYKEMIKGKVSVEEITEDAPIVLSCDSSFSRSADGYVFGSHMQHEGLPMCPPPSFIFTH